MCHHIAQGIEQCLKLEFLSMRATVSVQLCRGKQKGIAIKSSPLYVTVFGY